MRPRPAAACGPCSTAPISRSTRPSAPVATASSAPTRCSGGTRRRAWPPRSPASPPADTHLRDTVAVAAPTVSITFDNLGEAAELERGAWPDDQPVGEHFSVRESLPQLLSMLAAEDLPATFF